MRSTRVLKSTTQASQLKTMLSSEGTVEAQKTWAQNTAVMVVYEKSGGRVSEKLMAVNCFRKKKNRSQFFSALGLFLSQWFVLDYNFILI